MRFKAGVRVEDLKPQTVLAMMIVDTVYQQITGGEPVGTSVNDSRHMLRSKHYTGRAFDVRTKGVPHIAEAVAEIKKRLAPLGFDVLWESKGQVNEHLHLEVDPK